MQFHAYCGLLHQRKGLTKTLRIMKLTAIILLIGCLHLSAKGYTQKITLSEKNAPFKKVLHEIEKQAGYQFLFFDDDLKLAKTVTIEARNTDFDEVLRQ